ncbi:phosphoglycolate phosphatase [Saccharopolyspora erythraea NRRL 2338]|uniref:HAD-superfamily hydrolase subfamily IA, variant 3 n=2 Tax=Saccharopolyspora erythraea TaxID=1836 RepID=A4FHX9_SACEN|nr:HAD family hydrolase [Saccharopolyspora erythraea]PFG97339.1 phosphoglycolate phosphatase [Saccharopolyspora erythraea NRRL 2338]QRK87526.1 HAD family hydrolase [Saccharopolyspora erythraea]CAM03654.1 HAD-superfamily hydrolase subfamily IA, variant 3 [Saccharopolyspora erythraea NRRL 2338]
MPDTAVFDIDGTLVDSNYQHALAWFRAFRRFDLTMPVWRLHRAIGMGGDQFVQHVAGERTEREHGDDLRKAHGDEFDQLVDEVRPLEGARDLLEEIRRRGFRLALATSAKRAHAEHFLDLLGGSTVADDWVTSAEVERTKPAPDLIDAAMHAVEGRSAVFVGDSAWDCYAAGRLGIPTLGVRTGGWAAAELFDAGASAVYDSLPQLRSALDHTPLAAAD